MNHYHYLSLLLCFFANYLTAQNATLMGKIIDEKTKEPLIAATISANSIGVVTDVNGDYQLKLEEGTYSIQVNYIGYQQFNTDITINANEEQTLNIGLEMANTVLQTTTVTSGRYEKPLSEVTVSLEVLKPDLLESNNTVDVSSVLSKVPGVMVIDGQANIRGGSGYSYGAGSRVLVLVDDIPLLTADAGSANWRDIPVENLSQIEVVKGAASALYGSSALNGIINFRTAYAKSEAETKITAFSRAYLKPKNDSLAWWDSPRMEFGGSVIHRQKLGKFDLVVGGLYSNEQGLVQDTDPEAEREGTFRNYGRFNTNLRYRITDDLSIGLNANINRGESKTFFYWNGIDELYVGDQGTKSEGSQLRYNIDPFVTYFDPTGNRHKLLGRFYGVNNSFNNNQSNGSSLYYSEYQFQRNIKKIGLTTTAGIVATGSSTEAELYGDNEYSSFNSALYVQLEKKFFNRLNLSTGFRYERNTLTNAAFFDEFAEEEVAAGKTTEAKPVFRVGANYQLADFTFLRASWGEGYRFPTVAEKYIFTMITNGVSAVPNPNLRSETGWTTELGVKQGFRISEFEGFLDVSAFWSEYQDMMEFNLVVKENIFTAAIPFGFQSRNVGNTRIRGIETTVTGRGSLFGLPTTLLAGYNFIDPEFQEWDIAGKGLASSQVTQAPIAQQNANNSSSDENVLKYRSRHIATFDIESTIDKLAIGIGASYNSHMEAIDRVIEVDPRVVPDADIFRANDEDGYILLGLRASYRISPNLKVAALVNNLLNEEYAVRIGELDAPRNVSARLEVKF
ncbi:MAG: TonB-dependent receptor [Bacteroidota bacterium]